MVIFPPVKPSRYRPTKTSLPTKQPTAPIRATEETESHLASPPPAKLQSQAHPPDLPSQAHARPEEAALWQCFLLAAFKCQWVKWINGWRKDGFQAVIRGESPSSVAVFVFPRDSIANVYNINNRTSRLREESGVPNDLTRRWMREEIRWMWSDPILDGY